MKAQEEALFYGHESFREGRKREVGVDGMSRDVCIYASIAIASHS